MITLFAKLALVFLALTLVDKSKRTFTYLSTGRLGSLFTCFLNGLCDRHEPQVIGMKKKLSVLATEDDLLLDLTFHGIPALCFLSLRKKSLSPTTATT
jgi:hypothetical protein